MDDDARRIMQDRAARVSALASRYEGERGRNDSQAMTAAYAGAGGTLAGLVCQPERHKPAFWWAIEAEPWKRIGAEVRAKEEQKKRLAEAHDQCVRATAAAFALLSAR
jgi:hypothetical protein